MQVNNCIQVELYTYIAVYTEFIYWTDRFSKFYQGWNFIINLSPIKIFFYVPYLYGMMTHNCLHTIVCAYSTAGFVCISLLLFLNPNVYVLTYAL